MVELWGKVISLRGDRCCETTEPVMNPCERARVGDFPVRSSREWSGGFAFLGSLSYHVSKCVKLSGVELIRLRAKVVIGHVIRTLAIYSVQSAYNIQIRMLPCREQNTK